MNKRNFILLIMIYCLLHLWADDSNTWTETDTLKIYNDKVYVHYIEYRDSMLVEEADAFLYPTSWEVPKYRFFPFFFKETVRVDSIVYHGMVKSYAANRKYWIGKYENGVKLSMAYFDSSGVEISHSDFYGRGLRIDFDPEQGYNIFRITGRE